MTNLKKPRTQMDVIITWWTERFCHSPQSREFVQQMHGVIPKTKDKRARWKQYERRNQRYLINFEWHAGKLLVIGTTSESKWATGIIYIEANGDLKYCTFNPAKLID